MNLVSRLPLLSTFAVIVVLGLGAGAAGIVVDHQSFVDLANSDYFVLVLAVALGDRLVLPRQLGRATAMSVAVLASMALMGVDPRTVVAVAAAGWLVQALRSLRVERTVRMGTLLSTTFSAWAMAGAAVVAASLATELWWWPIGKSSLHVLPVLVVWALVLLAGPGVEALEVALRAERGRWMRYRDLVRHGLLANTVVASTATLGALAYEDLGESTILLMALPLLAAKLGFDRNTETRINYDQTLRAMSRLPEQLGAIDPGHGVRSGEVAAMAAVELGFGTAIVTDIERAAQLHELGRIRTEDGLDLTPQEVAHGGAEIIREAGDLDRVSDLIGGHRGNVAVGDEVAWVGGAIIRLACDLDLRLTARGERSLQPADQSWIRAQGVQPRIAEAVIRAAQVHYAPAPA